MELFAVVGLICFLLTSAIALVLPIALAVWVSPVWLWLYLVYLVFVFVAFVILARMGDKLPKRRKPGEV